MKYSSAALVATMLQGTAAHAAPITVQAYSYATFQGLLGSNAIVEDFEDPSEYSYTFEGVPNGTAPNQFGEVAGSIDTKVGSFTGLGNSFGSYVGTPDGTTCQALDLVGDGCSNIALQFDPDVNNQGNIVPDGGDWSINANDTLGMEWVAELAGGGLFSSLVFAIRDVTDQGADFSVTANGVTESFTNLLDGNEQLFMVKFAGGTNQATVTMRSSQVNDSFTFDGAAINPVPLPASALLLMGGLGLMAGLRRRKAA